MSRFVLILWVLVAAAWADVKSTAGQIKFDTESDNQAEMTLNATGLGIGVSPSTNLHVNGNAVISDQLFVGGASGSSNLNVNGTLGHSYETVSSNQLISNESMVFVDSDTAGANIDLQLEFSSNQQGLIYSIKNLGSTYSTRLTHDEGLFDVSSPSLLLNPLSSVELLAHGNSYYILSQQGSVNTMSHEFNAIKDCVLWLDASDSSTLSVDGSGNVTTWIDKSDQAYVFTDHGGEGSHPSITSNWRNGLNSLTFDPSTQEYLRSTTNLDYSDNEFTGFIVLDNNTSSTDGNSAVFTIDGAGNPSLWFRTGSDGTLTLSNQHSSSFSSVSIGGAKDTVYQSTFWFDQSQETKYISVSGLGSTTSTSASDSDIANPLVQNNAAAWLGCQKISAGAAPKYRSFGGNVGELLFYSRRLHADEINAVESYLAEKWNL
jgi:hypothetical protein